MAPVLLAAVGLLGFNPNLAFQTARLSAALSFVNARPQDERGLQQRLTILTRNYMAEHPELPAMYAFIAKDGAIKAQVALGTTDSTNKDQLRIGSNSKAVTATLLAILIEKNLISWSTTVEQAFPDLADRYSQSKVLKATIWHLLCHHGGVKALNVDAPDFKGLQGTAWRKKYLELALADMTNPGPGQENIYGPGPIIAVAMAEKATGKTFEALFAEHVAKPLSLTSFCMGAGSRTPVGWWYRQDEGSSKPAPRDYNSYIGNDPGGGICLSMADMAKVHSLRAGVRFRAAEGQTVGLSDKNRGILNTAPWAAQDGAAMGIYYETDVGARWLGHAGNTGCGDWSRVSILRDGNVICFYYTNYNRPGYDSRTSFGYKDYSTSLRTLALQYSRE